MKLEMDNFSIDITARGGASLIKAMEIAFSHNSPSDLALAYWITEETGLVFRWDKDHSDIPRSIPLPFRLDAAGAADFAMRWLAEQDYGREPDHDGDNAHGWRLYIEDGCHVAGDRYAICAVKPEWAMQGK